MARLPTLLERFKSLCKKQIEIAVELETVEREMLAVEAGRPATAPTRLRKPSAPARSKPKTKGQISAVTREMAIPTLKAMREAGGGEPVLRRDVAKQLGIGDYACTYRLQRLKALGFVESVGAAHYRVAKEVPEL